MNIALIIIGIVLVIIGATRIFSSQGKEATETPVDKTDITEHKSDVRSYQESEINNKKNIVSENSVLGEDKGSEYNSQKDYKQIGNDFEGYIADLLKANGIRLKQWNQGTTSPEGAYAENELNPDFLVSHKSGNIDLEYWIECKYRSSLPKEGFRLEDYQTNRYKKIQGQSKKKILIALGMGGNPSEPETVYIIPLDSLTTFKRIGHKYLPHYRLQTPRQNLKTHINDWFVNEVFNRDNK